MQPWTLGSIASIKRWFLYKLVSMIKIPSFLSLQPQPHTIQLMIQRVEQYKEVLGFDVPSIDPISIYHDEPDLLFLRIHKYFKQLIHRNIWMQIIPIFSALKVVDKPPSNHHFSLSIPNQWLPNFLQPSTTLVCNFHSQSTQSNCNKLSFLVQRLYLLLNFAYYFIRLQLWA